MLRRSAARAASHLLVARLDSAGDVLLSGPAVRALANVHSRVTYLASSTGAEVARLLPGVDDVIVFDAPWVGVRPPHLDRAHVERLCQRVESLGIDAAVIFTSFHQSSLPLALILRMAGVPWVAGASEDYPGSLLDLRHQLSGDHEVERMLSLAYACGGDLGDDDDARLRIADVDVPPLLPADYVVLHPGTSVGARRWPAGHWRMLGRLLADSGQPFVVTGAPHENNLTAAVAQDLGLDLGGRTTWSQLAGVLAGARTVIVANTGPAHLAAAVGTSVVSLFAPTVPVDRWRPFGVPHVILASPAAPCAGSRFTDCPFPGHPCLSDITPEMVLHALNELTASVA